MASFREFVEKVEKEGKLVKVKRELSKELELAGIMKYFEGSPVLAENIKGSSFRAVGNLFATRELVAEFLGVPKEKLVHKLAEAVNGPSKPEVVEEAAFMEKREENVTRMPIPLHLERDGGPYICSGIVMARDPELGQNCSYHRMMQLDGNSFSVRILPRHLHKFIEKAGGELDVAVVVGAPINVMLASAVSSKLGENELEIANSLAPLKVHTLSNGIEVPAEAEFVLEGKITNEMADEGPFLDLTETFDIVRKQNVLRVKHVWHRKDALFHVLLPGGMEHKLLMGMPREPTILNEVNKVAECTGVNVTPGGCSWLHAVVGIRKKGEEDGKKAVEAAFAGHRSLKRVIVVDEDIDIHDPEDVEWALATRFQAKNGLSVREEPGSSLDPSADPESRVTSKVGMDATKPLAEEGRFGKGKFMEIKDPQEYVEV